jgi:acetoacetyl-CoA synthetase
MDPSPEIPLWQPSPDAAQSSALRHFMRETGRCLNQRFDDYDALHEWSVSHPEQFWSALWDFCGVIGDKGTIVIEDGDRMPGARFFPEARLNYAENLLRNRTAADALIFRSEDKVRRRLTWAELYDSVSRLRQALQSDGVGPGDRVAGYMPNMPEAVIAMIATSSLGAVWTSCSPDFGPSGVLDRFGQIAPKAMIMADGYHYGGKTFDCMNKGRSIVAGLPSLERVIVVPHIRADVTLDGLAGASSYADYVGRFQPGEIMFPRFAFNHPLVVVYSSGTTGVPKCLIHGAGGTLLKNLSDYRLNADLQPGDRFFQFTTCGWIMWNLLVTGLASGATLLLYDGSPFHPDGNVLFDYAAEEKATLFGTSAKYIDALAKSGIEPGRTHDLSTLRGMTSTGSPLTPESFDYIYRAIKSDICLASISGGTDIIAAFVGGNPIGPVWRGEIQCAMLGMAMDIFDDSGRPAPFGEKGELVCTRPFPSMPVGFWNDPDGARYHAAYFERFANIWCHGDFAARTPHGGYVIYGRSDAILNPGGVRIGTAEIYRQVELVPEVLESLVIAQDWQGDVRVVLFVKLREGLTLDDALVKRINQKIRDNASPRHVPARTVQVIDIPRTRSGKIVELAVRDLVHGRPVKNLDALANPEALEHFRDRPELKV